MSTLIITSSICIIYYPIKKFRYKKKNKLLNNSQNLEYLKNQILLGNNSLTIKTICKAYNLENLTAIDKNNHYVDNFSKTDVYFLFNNENPSNEEIISIYKNSSYHTIKIFCINPISLPLVNNYEISINNINNIKSTLAKSNMEIDYNIIIKKNKKITLKETCIEIFNKKKSKSYLGFGFLLIITSFFNPYNIYYILIGTALIFLSLYSRFNKKFNIS